MTILSKELNASITSFIMNFYKFQEEMRITNQKCFHNVKYIKEYIKEKYNLTLKDFNGFIIVKNQKLNQFRKIEHNWIEYDGDIIEPNKDLYDLKLKNCIDYFKFTEKKKMYKKMRTPRMERITDIEYQKDHITKYILLNKSNSKYGREYLRMIRTRIINKEDVEDEIRTRNNHNMIEQLKQMGGVHIYM